MIIQVIPEFCTGWGVCIDECPTGAILLVEQRAVIDDAVCTQCQACGDACPNGAITAILIPVQSAVLDTRPEADSHFVSTPSKNQPVEPAPAHRLAPLAGAVLAFLGKEVAPRLADVVINSLERSLTQRAAVPTTSRLIHPGSRITHGQGLRKKTRSRRGCATQEIQQRGGM